MRDGDAAPLLLTPASRAEWRDWLAAHHGRDAGLWVVLAKKGMPRLHYDDAAEETLCFGWIDSLMRPIDEGHFRQWFSPRRPGSGWSARNKERVARLEEAGLMAPPGREKVAAARADGSWGLHDAADTLTLPDDRATALRGAPGAEEGFAALRPSLRRGPIAWVLSAKRPQTRADRVAKVVAAALGGPLSPG